VIIRRLLALCVLLTACTTCTTPPVPEPTPPDPQPADAGPPPTPTPDAQPVDPVEACNAAEATLKWLGCMRPDGKLWHVGFAQACVDAYNDGRDWNARCIAVIESCDALEAAYRGELCPGN
jgi:hypothetical protein